MVSSTGVGVGVGDWTSICATNGALCGNGDISIMSMWAGDDDGGSGGVVTYSACVVSSPVQRQTERPVARLPRPPIESIMADVVNNARRGVGNMGLLQNWDMLVPPPGLGTPA